MFKWLNVALRNSEINSPHLYLKININLTCYDLCSALKFGVVFWSCLNCHLALSRQSQGSFSSVICNTTLKASATLEKTRTDRACTSVKTFGTYRGHREIVSLHRGPPVKQDCITNVLQTVNTNTLLTIPEVTTPQIPSAQKCPAPYSMAMTSVAPLHSTKSDVLTANSIKNDLQKIWNHICIFLKTSIHYKKCADRGCFATPSTSCHCGPFHGFYGFAMIRQIHYQYKKLCCSLGMLQLHTMGEIY